VEVVPRWEWRTFGDAFDDAQQRLDSFEPDREQESDEIYLLSLDGDASVKLRDELVDVKRLEQVDDDGLELWRPVMKTAFPLSAEDSRAVLTAVAAAVPPLTRDEYTLQQFGAEIVEPDPRLLALSLHKRRVHYLVDDCMVEVTDVTTASEHTRTIAIESPEPALVVATIARLGLAGRTNVNMARGLKDLIGFGARRNAVIDVGTNSVKFFMAEAREDGSQQVLADGSEITRLGEGLEASGALADEAVRRTVDAVARMVDEARAAGASAITIVGTAGLRSASNATAFDVALHDRSGMEIEIISARDEGQLAYLAATSALPRVEGRTVVFDSGGGSTQFTFGHGEQVDDRFSLDVGAVRISDRYGLRDAVSREQLDAALDAIDADLAPLDDRPAPDAIVAMGGTITNLAAVKHALAEYDADVVRGTVLDLAEIDRQIERYRTRRADERREIVGLQPARADVILGGACLVRTILAKLGTGSLTVTDRGLRHGVYIDRFT
jgi:exopolyphosphatase/guanosine-5'-triphosphate,3'-diphosphate pyrophosphatase